MAKFKVGDRVRYIGKDGLNITPTAREILDISATSYMFNGGNIHISSAEKVNGSYEMILVDSKQEKTMKKTNTPTRNWSFESRSIRDIDFDAINNELSHANPIALVEAQRTCVVVHNTLLVKALTVHVSMPDGVIKGNGNMYELGTVKPAEVVEWAKKVKNAPWPDLLRKKTTVTVNLLNI